MTGKSWQQASLDGLAALTVDAMPAVEVLLLDDIAEYLMGAGPRQPPYTVEHGSRVVSALFGAIVNSARFAPSEVPAPTPEITAARAQIVRGAHDFATRGIGGIGRLAKRVIPTALGELETHQNSPEKQTCLVCSSPSHQGRATSSTTSPQSERGLRHSALPKSRIASRDDTEQHEPGTAVPPAPGRRCVSA